MTKRETHNLGIVIIGYNNPSGIKRLLESLDSVDFLGDQNVTLIFSIDYSGNNSVAEIANSFEWNHGEKIVHAYEKNLGLKAHILKCGDYLTQHNLDAIAVLEDDIYVAPMMYSFMKAAVPYYIDDPQIAGISLYKHEINLLAKKPFIDNKDGNDVFFIQYAQSWGQIWLKDKWNNFKQWYEKSSWESMDQTLIPTNILKWDNSWLKYHIMYCIDKGMYFVYPRESLTTNFSDAGAHRSLTSTRMQVPLLMAKKSEWIFTRVDQSKAVYDAFFESTLIPSFLNKDDLIVDMYGVRKEKKRYVISTLALPYTRIYSWGLMLRPIENNIFLNCTGNDIYLYDTAHHDKTIVEKGQKQRVFDYELRGINILSRAGAKHVQNRILSNIRYRIKILRKQLKKRGGK